MKHVFWMVLAGALGASLGTEASSVVMERPDGSKQCEPKPDARAISEMTSQARAELKKVSVRVLKLYRVESDGKMRIQMCGSPTGAVIRIRIRAKDAARVEALGFRQVQAKNQTRHSFEEIVEVFDS